MEARKGNGHETEEQWFWWGFWMLSAMLLTYQGPWGEETFIRWDLQTHVWMERKVHISCLSLVTFPLFKWQRRVTVGVGVSIRTKPEVNTAISERLRWPSLASSLKPGLPTPAMLAGTEEPAMLLKTPDNPITVFNVLLSLQLLGGQCLKLCLAYHRHSVNACWMNEWISKGQTRETALL